MKIKIKKLNAEGDPNYANIKENFVYDTIETPEGASTTRAAVYVQGANGPAPLFEDEYEVIDESRPWLTAYNVKTKTKGNPIYDAVITKNSKGSFLAQGHDGQGNKLTTLVAFENAEKAVANGVAKQGW